jgi:hypothetical protein
MELFKLGFVDPRNSAFFGINGVDENFSCHKVIVWLPPIWMLFDVTMRHDLCVKKTI